MANVFEVSLRRQENSQPWGFRLRGGADQGIPLHIEHVAPNGRSAHAGLHPGDMVLAICKSPTQNMSHGQVKQEVLRAGNDIDLLVQRDTGAPPPQQRAAEPQAQAPRSEVIEEPTAKLGGPRYKEVKPKTYQVLADELPASETGAAPKPASIFDRKKQERSGYLQASGSSIQKAYGQKS